MKQIVFSLCILFTVFTISAQDKSEENKRKLGLYANVDLLSESIWHGWDLSNNKAAYIPYVSLDLWGTGFETAFWASMPVDRDDKSLDDYEFMLKYNTNIYTGILDEINFHGFVDYIHLPGQTEFPYRPVLGDDLTYLPQYGLKQLWKMNFGLSFNKLLPVGNNYIVPAYNIYYIAPAGNSYFKSGSVHDFSLSYSQPVSEIVKLNISTNAFYHYRIFEVEAWGGAVVGSSLSFKLSNNINFNTQINYQKTLSNKVNSGNELWGGAGLSFSL